MVTLLATADPNHWPPRVRLDLSTDVAGETFTAIRVRRNGVLLREQPYAGGETAVTYDYECPRGVPVTYTAEVERAGWTILRNETWASLSGWTQVGPETPAVSGGRLTAGWVARAVSATQPNRVVIPDVAQWGSLGSLRYGSLRITFDGSRVRVARYTSPTNIVGVQVTSGPATITWSGGVVTVTAGTQTSSGPIAPGTEIDEVWGFEGAGAFRIESAAITAATATDTTQLDVQALWLINPIAPALSMPVDSGDCSRDDDYLSLVWPTGERKESAAARNVWNPVGRRRAVVITTGPRYDYDWSLTVKAPSIAHQYALRELLGNQSPLLFLQPAGLQWDLEDGWYSVGDVSIAREVNAVVDQSTYLTLPLTPIDPPAVSQGAVRTWGDVAGEAATWADLLELYPTWTDVLAGA